MARAFRCLYALGLVVACALACGGSALETTPRSGEPERRALDELDALEHDLTLSERRVLSSLEQKSAYSAQPPSQAAQTGEAAAESAPAPPAEPRAETPCDIACRALASMRRSADRICELAGNMDERCARARARVERANEQIAAARCRCPHED